MATHMAIYTRSRTYAERPLAMAAVIRINAWERDKNKRRSEARHGSPRPDLPTNLKSLKRATWFLNKALLLRRSAALFSSFPALRSTLVPSGTSLSDNTLKGTGRVLLQRQWEGRIVQTKFGLLVRTSSPGYSAKTSENVRSPLNVLPTWPFCCEVGVSLGEEAITDATWRRLEGG